jgi:hypothetical protein
MREWIEQPPTIVVDKSGDERDADAKPTSHSIESKAPIVAPLDAEQASLVATLRGFTSPTDTSKNL